MIRTGRARRCMDKTDENFAEAHAFANLIIKKEGKYIQKHISVDIDN